MFMESDGIFAPTANSTARKHYPGLGLDLVLPMLLTFLLLWHDWMARPACLTRRSQPRSTSTIAIFIKTFSVGRTHSIGIASQCFVGQTMRNGDSLHALSITWTSRPVIISPQTRQYRF